MSFPNLIYPDSSDCPSSIAEAVYNIRTYRAGEKEHKILREKYATLDYFMLAAEFAYAANGWVLSTQDKKLLREAFRGPKKP